MLYIFNGYSLKETIVVMEAALFISECILIGIYRISDAIPVCCIFMVSRPETQSMDFTFEQSEQGRRQPENILVEELERDSPMKYLGTTIEEEGGMGRRPQSGWEMP